jgi:hypothetical protein
VFPFAEAVGAAVSDAFERMILAGPRVVGHLTMGVIFLILAGALAATAALFSSERVIQVTVIALLALAALMILGALGDLLRAGNAARPVVEPVTKPVTRAKKPLGS